MDARTDRLIEPHRFLTDREIPVSVRIHGQRDLKLHRHGFTELVVVLDGVGDHLLDADSFPICAGDVFVIDEQHSHGYHDTRDLHIANVLFDEAYLGSRAPSLVTVPGYQAFVHLEPRSRRRLEFEGRLRLSPERMIEVRATVSRLAGELEEQRDGYVAAATALLVQLIVGICRAYTESESEAHRDLLDIGRVIGYIENHYAEPIQLEDLQELVAMSERSLLRKFHRTAGTSPKQYLLRVRVSHAERLLRTTSGSVTEIAGAVGFEDGNYFARKFRQATGLSPSAFRRSTEPQ